jgi:hypothetical protein
MYCCHGLREAVHRYRDSSGWRGPVTRLTPDGRRAMHTIREAQRTWADAIGAQVGEAELRQAGSTVNRLLEVLAQLGAERSASRTGQPSLPTPATNRDANAALAKE